MEGGGFPSSSDQVFGRLSLLPLRHKTAPELLVTVHLDVRELHLELTETIQDSLIR